MGREHWSIVVAAVEWACRRAERRSRRPEYSDALIVKLFFWSVLHDRPRCWATDRTSYGPVYRPRRLPSNSQFCRRLCEPRTMKIIDAVSHRLAAKLEVGEVVAIDGKPLTVNNWSNDADAANGWGVGQLQRGYKLHAMVGEAGQLLAFTVLPLNVAEPLVAREHLVGATPKGALVLADGNYDSKKLHRAVANVGGQLVAPIRGARPRRPTLKTQPASRLEVLRMARRDKPLLEMLLGMRTRVERAFGTLSCTAGLLTSLPAWVRSMPRVKRWVTAKIALYHARLQLRSRSLETP